MEVSTGASPELVAVLPEKECEIAEADNGGSETPGARDNNGATQEDNDKFASTESDDKGALQ